MKITLIAVALALSLSACGPNEGTIRERIEELEARVDRLEEAQQGRCRAAWHAQATPEYWKAKTEAAKKAQ